MHCAPLEPLIKTSAHKNASCANCTICAQMVYCTILLLVAAMSKRALCQPCCCQYLCTCMNVIKCKTAHEQLKGFHKQRRNNVNTFRNNKKCKGALRNSTKKERIAGARSWLSSEGRWRHAREPVDMRRADKGFLETTFPSSWFNSCSPFGGCDARVGEGWEG